MFQSVLNREVPLYMTVLVVSGTTPVIEYHMSLYEAAVGYGSSNQYTPLNHTGIDYADKCNTSCNYLFLLA